MAAFKRLGSLGNFPLLRDIKAFRLEYLSRDQGCECSQVMETEEAAEDEKLLKLVCVCVWSVLVGCMCSCAKAY